MKSETAIEVNVRIMRAFTAMRNFHIIDEDVYHIGYSLKDLGKKLFGFSKMEVLTGSELLSKL